MANNFATPPAGFVGRNDHLTRFRTRLEHYNVFVYEGISGIGKTSLALRLGQETKAVGANRTLYLPVWPNETMTSILARVEARLNRPTSVIRDRSSDPYSRLWLTLEQAKTSVILDDLQNLRREELLALVRSSRGKRPAARIIGAMRGDPELSAIDKMDMHLDRVGPLNIDEVKQIIASNRVTGESAEAIMHDAARGGCVAHPLTLRYMLALRGEGLPPKSFLDIQSARSVNAFKALMAGVEGEGSGFDKRLDDKEREALLGIASVGQALEKEVAIKIFGAPVASLIKRNLVDVIDGDVMVHDLVASTLQGETQLSPANAKIIAKHFETRGRERNEPPLILRAAEILARSGDAATAVDILAEGWEPVCDLGFVEAYLKAIASMPATGALDKRLRLLSARARMRQGAPSVVREEMEKLSEERDTWTKQRALAALADIHAHIGDHAGVIRDYEALKRSAAEPELIAGAAALAASAMVQLDKVVDAEKLVKSLLGKLKKEPAKEAELRRMLARIYASSGRLDDAVKEAQLSAKAFEAAGDLYHAAAAYGGIGDLYREVGEFDAARTAFKKFHELATQSGDRSQVQIAELADAWVALDIGDLTSAGKAIAHVEANMGPGTRRLLRYLDVARAKLLAGRGQNEEAAKVYGEVVKAWDEAGNPNIADVLRAQQVRVLMALGRTDEAEAIIKDALERLDRASAGPRVAVFLRESALLMMRRGDVKRAQAQLADARKLLQAGGNRREEALTLHRIAQAAYEEANFELASERADEAVALAKQIKHERAIALSQEMQSRLALVRGDAKAAVNLSKEAMQGLRRLGDEVGALHAAEMHVRALVVAGDLAGAVRLGPKVSETAEKLEIRDVRIRSIILTGVALLRRGRPDAALRCFREVKDGQVAPGTVALMYRFGEALASVAGEKEAARERRERWIQAGSQVAPHQREMLVASIEALALPPRDRSHVRTAKAETTMGTERLAWLEPASYELFVDVQTQRYQQSGKAVSFSSREAESLLRELVVAFPKGLSLADAAAAVFGEGGDAKKLGGVIKDLQKDVKSIKLASTTKEVKLVPPKTFCVVVPTSIAAGSLSAQQQKILRLMRRMGTVALQAVQDEFAVPRNVAKKELDQLIAAGLIEAVRAGRGQAFRLA
ncbi:MAG: AAA family ATPase [Myxococcota bacterium]